MVHITGTANTPQEVYDTLLNWLTAAPLSWQVVDGSIASRDAVLQLPSSPSGEPVILRIRYAEDAANDKQALAFSAFRALNPQAAGTADHYDGTAERYTWMAQQGLTYWFTADSTRAVGVIKSSSMYHPFYLGLFLPHCLPQEYLLPIFVAGSTGRWGPVDLTWASQWDEVRPGLTDPSRYQIHSLSFDRSSAAVYTHNMIWRDVENVYESLSPDIENRYRLWPRDAAFYQNDHILDSYDTTRYRRWLSDGVAHGDGTVYAVPIEIHDRLDFDALGTLTGVYAVPGSLLTEAQVTINGNQHIVFPSIWRIGGDEMWAMEAF